MAGKKKQVVQVVCAVLLVVISMQPMAGVQAARGDDDGLPPPCKGTPTPTPPPPSTCHHNGCQPSGPTPTAPVTPWPKPPVRPPVTPTPKPPVKPPQTPPVGGGGQCPMDALKLSVCANVLNLLKLKIGVPESEQCCPLLGGLVDLDAAVCLCTAIKANILGINLNVPVDLTLLLNFCGKKCPDDFTCPD